MRRTYHVRVDSFLSRIDAVLTQRQALIEKRRQAAAHARLQKERLLQLMDNMRGKANTSTSIQETLMLTNDAESIIRSHAPQQQQQRAKTTSEAILSESSHLPWIHHPQQQRGTSS
jgi:hypothetical protein